jgi:hypothetical protein
MNSIPIGMIHDSCHHYYWQSLPDEGENGPAPFAAEPPSVRNFMRRRRRERHGEKGTQTAQE